MDRARRCKGFGGKRGANSGRADAMSGTAMRFFAPLVLAALLPAGSARAVEPDLEYGAFQRGYYLTALSLATQRATEKSDPKAMTLIGEIYANGLGIPQNDAKASEWYRFAANRGDANAMFA